MPSTPVTGIFSRNKNRLRDTLAACYYFQRWTADTWTEAEAKERIYLDALPPPPDGQAYTLDQMKGLRPFALIYQTGVNIEVNAEPGGFKVRGTLTIVLEQNVPDNISGDPGEIDRQFDNFLSDVVFTGNDSQPGLLDLSKIAEQGYTKMATLESDGPARTVEARLNDVGDASQYLLHISWGVR